MTDATDVLLDRLVVHPPLRAALGDLHEASLGAIDRELLAACEARIAMLIGLDPPPEVSARATISAGDQACLDFVEQSVLDVSAVTDAQVAALAEHLGDDGAATFVCVALVAEQRLRMRAMWLRLGLEDAS